MTTEDHAHTPEENLAMVDELILSQEDQPQTHRSTRPLAQSAVIRIIFLRDLRLKKAYTAVADLTEAIHDATQDFKKAAQNTRRMKLSSFVSKSIFKEHCGRRFTASMYTTIEQLNKILSPYD